MPAADTDLMQAFYWDNKAGLKVIGLDFAKEPQLFIARALNKLLKH